MTNARNHARRLLLAPAALLAAGLLAGCMGGSPQLVNVEPSFVHDRHASSDAQVAASWPVMPTQQAMANRNGAIAETAYLGR